MVTGYEVEMYRNISIIAAAARDIAKVSRARFCINCGHDKAYCSATPRGCCRECTHPQPKGEEDG